MVCISGIQQIGIGVRDVESAFKWYRQHFGFDIPIFEDNGVAELMLPYTNNQPQNRHAILAINMQGGGGLEIWQYTSREPQSASFEIMMGDLGINVVKLKTLDISKAFDSLKNSGVNILGDIFTNPAGNKCFFVKDPFNNIFEIVSSNIVFQNTRSCTGGVYGAIIGVDDMDKSLAFYKNILGYDEILHDVTDNFNDLNSLPGGEHKLRRVLITHSKKRTGPFSSLLNSSVIELVKAVDREPNKIFQNRLWGDLGFIHLCYDIQGMEGLKNICEENGYAFTIDSNPESYLGKEGTFDMGEAAGHFTYTEDPNGTLIEFVETHKVPILKSMGWYIDLRKRNHKKPLPKWMLSTMKWKRVKT